MDGLQPVEPNKCLLEVLEAQNFAVDPTLAVDQGWVMLRLKVVNPITFEKSWRNLEQTGLEGVPMVLLSALERSVNEDRLGGFWGHGVQYSG